MLRPLAWSALLGAIVSAVVVIPASADPSTPDAVPDPGIRPSPRGALHLPGGTPRATPHLPPSIPRDVGTSIQARIAAAQATVATLGQQLRKVSEELATAKTDEASARAKLHQAEAARLTTERLAQTAAADLLKRAATLPPRLVESDLYRFSVFVRLQRGRAEPADTSAAARAALRAQAAERDARQAYQEARDRLTSLTARYDELKTKYDRAEAELTKLEKEHAEEKTRLEQQREAREQEISEEIIRNARVDGLQAHPKALAALAFALKQLGKPYRWAAEGPDAYDCSGLVWAAYRSVGYRLPRVASDQYYATRRARVDRSALLPGDLIFFASGPDWQSIHHVGMYVGGGKMVHAPNSNDVVKVSTVWWSRFYAATRVFPAVPVPAPSPSPTARPSPLPTPTRPATPSLPPPTTPDVRPTPSPTALPSPSGTRTPTTAPSSPPSPSAPPTTPRATPSSADDPSADSGAPTAGRTRSNMAP
ncbi:MAG TPA: NlpC/P60 family protein [Micromonospora sp.]